MQKRGKLSQLQQQKALREERLRVENERLKNLADQQRRERAEQLKKNWERAGKVEKVGKKSEKLKKNWEKLGKVENAWGKIRES